MERNGNLLVEKFDDMKQILRLSSEDLIDELGVTDYEHKALFRKELGRTRELLEQDANDHYMEQKRKMSLEDALLSGSAKKQKIIEPRGSVGDTLQIVEDNGKITQADMAKSLPRYQIMQDNLKIMKAEETKRVAMSKKAVRKPDLVLSTSGVEW